MLFINFIYILPISTDTVYSLSPRDKNEQHPGHPRFNGCLSSTVFPKASDHSQHQLMHILWLRLGAEARLLVGVPEHLVDCITSPTNRVQEDGPVSPWLSVPVECNQCIRNIYNRCGENSLLFQKKVSYQSHCKFQQDHSSILWLEMFQWIS